MGVLCSPPHSDNPNSSTDLRNRTARHAHRPVSAYRHVRATVIYLLQLNAGIGAAAPCRPVSWGPMLDCSAFQAAAVALKSPHSSR